MMPADRHPVLVAAVRERGERAVDARAQRLAQRLQRVRGDEQADRLLLDGEQLGLVELLAGIGGCRAAATPAAGGRSGAARRRLVLRSKIEPWPISASCWAFWPAACACSSTSSIPCGVAPVEPNAPHLISASIAFLLTVRLSTRSQKSHSEVNSPPSSRARLIASTAW